VSAITHRLVHDEIERIRTNAQRKS
jgi:hypothetical protein